MFTAPPDLNYRMDENPSILDGMRNFQSNINHFDNTSWQNTNLARKTF